MCPAVWTRRSGYHLSEILISLIIVAILASMVMSRIYYNVHDERLSALKKSSKADLTNIHKMAESTLGTLPVTFGMSSLLSRFGGLTQFNPAGNFVGLCPTGGEDSFRFPNGAVVTHVSTTWPDQAGNADDVCLALQGANSKTPGKDVFWLRFFRDGAADVAELDSSKTQYGIVTTVAIGGLLTFEEFISQIFTGGGTDLPLIYQQLYGAVTSNLNMVVDDMVWTIADTDGQMVELTPAQFAQGLSIGGIPWELVQPSYSAMPITPFQSAIGVENGYSAQETAAYWQVRKAIIDQLAKLNGAGLGIDSSSILGFTKVNDTANSQAAIDAIRNLNVVYQDPVTKKYYEMSAMTFYSPVKLSLNGVSAKLNSDDFFPFDVDGKAGKMAPFVTTGGVNKNEAWLATDRNGDGFWVKGVQDGRDVFGDHLGRYKSGYDDLAALYKHSLKKDANGKRYIALKKLSFLEKQQANVARLTSKPMQFDPSIDLKLLTRDRKVFFASDFVDKIYVDYQDVNELDAKKQNWIRQRAQVHYLGGQTVTSADQWFQAGLIFTPMTDAEVKVQKSRVKS